MTTDQQLIIDEAVHRAQQDNDRITLRAIALLKEQVEAEWIVAKEVEVARDENKRLVKQVEDYRAENARLEKRIKELEGGRRDKQGRFSKGENKQPSHPPIPEGWEFCPNTTLEDGAPYKCLLRNEWADANAYITVCTDKNSIGFDNLVIRPIQKASHA